MPDFSLFFQLLPNALSISFVVIAVHISLAKMFAKKMSYKVDAGQVRFKILKIKIRKKNVLFFF